METTIEAGQLWKEIDEDMPQTYRVIKAVYSKSGNTLDHYVIQNVEDEGDCGYSRVGLTFFEYATLVN